MNYQECNLGFTFQNEKVLVFFGKANCTIDLLKAKFAKFEIFQIHQTHSDIIVEGSQTIQTADAHWTSQKNKALLIRTADCIPAFFYHPKTNVIAAVHAGWRGIENQIIYKSLQKVLQTTMIESELDVWIGPHILQNSFEVDLSVKELLIKSSFNCLEKELSFVTGDKFFIDLQKIAYSQISEAGRFSLNRFNLEMDTKNNIKFNSYRRDRGQSGRNLSFITLL